MPSFRRKPESIVLLGRNQNGYRLSPVRRAGKDCGVRDFGAMNPRPSLLRSTLTFSGGTFVSRILGLVREQAIAYAFGANAATDAFWVAFRIPNFLRRLFAEGSFSVAFVPVFTEVKEKRSHEDLKELVARTAGTLGGVLLVVTALGVLGAGFVARGFAPGSIDEPVKLALTTDLLRITFPFL